MLRNAEAPVTTGEAPIAQPIPTPLAPAAAPAPTPPAATAQSTASEASLRAKVLAEFSLDGASAEEVRAAMGLYKARQAALKAESEGAQKPPESPPTDTATQAKLGEMGAAFRALAATELAKLTNEQRAAVVAIAGDDPAKAILTIHNLRPTWGTPEATKPPANTAPATVGVPSPAGAPVKADSRAQYEELQRSNPFLAAAYLARNPRALG